MRDDKSANATRRAWGKAFTTAPRLSDTPNGLPFPAYDIFSRLVGTGSVPTMVSANVTMAGPVLAGRAFGAQQAFGLGLNPGAAGP